MKTEREKMTAGEPFWTNDPQLMEDKKRARRLAEQYNRSSEEEPELRQKLLREIFGRCGEKIFIKPPFHCDYGYNILIGENFFANFDCVFLDAATITIGDNCLIGPKTCIYAIGHPMDAEERKKELMDRNEMNGLMFKMENDPRIIGSEKGPGKGIGNFIRKTSLDELPQFWNILKGDMSLVGTRPPTKAEYEQYDLHHKIRLSMKPGLTGMWQTSGRSDITDFEEIVKLDAQYIENWSLTLDLKLLFKTVAVVLKKEGSK